MDNEKVIIAFVVILVVILAAGILLLNPGHAKADSRVIVTSNSTLHDGDSFSIKLTDVNNTPIANQVVNVTIIDANGAENHQQVTTDANGDGSLQLNGLTVGKYNVVVSYGGCDNYSDCNTTQNLEMKEIEVEPEVESNVQHATSEPYVVSTSENGCILYWSDGHTTYRDDAGGEISKEQYEILEKYGKR